MELRSVRVRCPRRRCGDEQTVCVQQKRRTATVAQSQVCFRREVPKFETEIYETFKNGPHPLRLMPPGDTRVSYNTVPINEQPLAVVGR